MTSQPAARLMDEISHTSAMTGFLAGALAGLAIGVVVVAATVATGGAALAVVAAAGAAAASTGGGALLGAEIGQTFTAPAGSIAPVCALNVLINNRPAARAVIDMALCTQHFQGPPKPIATGAATVFINNFNAARVDEQTVCGGKISKGSDNVYIGGPSVQLLDIEPEIPEWMTTTAQVLAIGGSIVALGAGAAAAFMAGGMCALIGFGGEVIGGLLLGFVGEGIGSAIGEAIGGERGRIIGGAIGGFIGGFFGGRLGSRATRGHPVDVASGELFTEVTDFALPGPLPLSFSRVWMSSSAETGTTGSMGAKWHHSLDLRLYRWQEGGGIAVRLADGRLALFAHPHHGAPAINTVEQLVLELADTAQGTGYRLHDYSGDGWVFEPAPGKPDLWRLAAQEDSNGNRIRLGYDTRGHLNAITDSCGRELGVTCNNHGWISAIDGPQPDGEGRMRLVSYDYGAAGDMIAATDARGHAERYSFNNHLMTAETRRGGLVYHFRWDDVALGTAARCISTWGESRAAKVANLHRADFTWDDPHNRTLVTDATGAVTTYQRSDLGQVLSETNPKGLITDFTYDRAGHLTGSTDSAGRSLRATFDLFGRITARLGPKGETGAFTYGGDNPAEPVFGLMIEIANSFTGIHRFRYDHRGNTEVYTDPLGHEHRMLRDARGLLLAERDAEGTAWRWKYSPQGMLLAEGPGELRRHYSYDALGRPQSVRQNGQGTTRLEHDANGNLTRVILADGRTVRREYDAENQLIRFIDPVGRITQWDYAGLRMPVLRIEATGLRTEYAYDHEMRPALIVNQESARHVLRYSATGHLIEETGFDGRHRRFMHNIADHLIKVDNAGDITRYVNDRFGRVVEKYFPDGTTHRIEWAENDRVARAETPDCVLEFTYDTLQRITSTVQDGQRLEYRYDARGHRVAAILPDGEEITTSWRENGERAALALSGRHVAAWHFDPNGQLIRRDQGTTGIELSHDEFGRLTRQSLTPMRGPILRGGEVLVRRDYHWGADNTLSAVDDSLRGRSGYRYDGAEQLAEVDGPMPERLIYDPAGNLLAATIPDEAPAAPAPAPGNRVQVFGDAHFTYDEPGNIIRVVSGAGGHRVEEYTYGANDMLMQVSRSDRRGLTIIRFGYDAFNRRVRKTVIQGGDQPETLRDTAYLWDGDQLLAEGPAEGDRLARLYLYEPGSFTPLALADRPSADSKRRICHYNTDHLGTPQEVVDDQGRIIWTARYRAFGYALTASDAGFEQPIRFQGQYCDAETGLHYNRNRYYHPQAGRYTQPDPTSLLGGLNEYAYGPNPTGFIDPFGLVDLNEGGYSLYHIVDKNGNVAYVGITNNPDVRAGQHADTGRLGRGYRLEVQERNLTYAQARGYEQADIERFGTRDTSRRGLPMRPGDPNRVWSYDPDRTDTRAQAFNEHYDERMRRMGGCG